MRKVSHLQCLEQQLPPWRDAYNNLFASSPSDFSHTSDFRPISHATLLQRLGLFGDTTQAQHVPPTYTATRFGIRAELPLLCFEDSQAGMYSRSRTKIGFLLCEDAHERLVAVILRDASTYHDFTRLHDSTSSTLLVGARIPAKPGADKKRWSDHRLVAFTSDVLEHIRQSGRISVTLVHISKGATHGRGDPSVGAATNTNRTCSLVFPPWRKSALLREGFVVQETVVVSEAPSSLERKHVFVLSHDIHGIVRLVITLDFASSSLGLQMGVFSSGTLLTGDILMGEDVSSESEILRVEPLLRADDSTSTEVLYPLTGGARPAGTTGGAFLRVSATSSRSPRDVVFTLDLETIDNLSLTQIDS